MCLYPQLIRNKKYTKTKKNGGIIPAVLDNRVLAVPVACGRCMECRRAEARKWQIRLMEDVRTNKNGKCVTLTFSNESIKELKDIIGEEKTGYDLDNEIATIAVKRFRERWRKEYKKSIRHWLVTELGHNGTENVHMHGIIYTDEPIEKIRKHWRYGHIWVDQKNGWVNEITVNYITKYIKKMDFEHREYKSKVLTSAGIGASYIEREDSKQNKYTEGKTKEYYKTRQGYKIGLNVYWRNKIYTEEEREKLWIEKLDKNERWVDGKRIDVSKGDEEYYKILKQAREKNKKLGYGNNEKDWKRKEYEEKRRIMMTQKRIEDAEKMPPAGETFALDESKKENTIKWGNNNF